MRTYFLIFLASFACLSLHAYEWAQWDSAPKVEAFEADIKMNLEITKLITVINIQTAVLEEEKKWIIYLLAQEESGEPLKSTKERSEEFVAQSIAQYMCTDKLAEMDSFLQDPYNHLLFEVVVKKVILNIWSQRELVDYLEMIAEETNRENPLHLILGESFKQVKKFRNAYGYKNSIEKILLTMKQELDEEIKLVDSQFLNPSLIGI